MIKLKHNQVWYRPRYDMIYVCIETDNGFTLDGWTNFAFFSSTTHIKEVEIFLIGEL